MKKLENGEKVVVADLMKTTSGAATIQGGAFELIEVGKDLTPMIRAGAEGLTKSVDGLHLPVGSEGFGRLSNFWCIYWSCCSCWRLNQHV